jgi:kynurenine formamidase
MWHIENIMKELTTRAAERTNREKNRFLRGPWMACAFSALLAVVDSAGAGAQDAVGLWSLYNGALKDAKYIDLTHAFAPGQPIDEGFADLSVGPARASVTIPGVIEKGEPFSYEKQGAGITAYTLRTDQIGTQLDPPAHWGALGASISELPATFAVRPLVVIDVSKKVAANPGYEATVADIGVWEQKHGKVPEGSVVMIRSDWSKLWNDPARFTRRPFPGVSLEALKFLHLQRHILFHGHEPLDADMTPDFQAEAWVMHHNFTQAEGVANLDQVPEAGALIVIGFAKPEGGTGGFARYIAIAPADWPYGVTIHDAPGAPLPTAAVPLRRDKDGVLRRR